MSDFRLFSIGFLIGFMFFAMLAITEAMTPYPPAEAFLGAGFLFGCSLVAAFSKNRP